MSTKKTGVEHAERTTKSMEAVNTDMKQASVQIDATQASLDSLMKTGQMPAAQPQDVKVAYSAFSDNADKMETVGKNLGKDIDEMNAAGNTYFLEWAKEGGTYTNPQIQKQSEERRTELSSTFRDMESSAANSRGILNSYLAQVKQIKAYLSNDLTAEGISSVTPIAKNIEQEGNRLKQSFAPVEKSIMQARAQLTPGGAAAGGVSPTPQQPAEQKTNEPAAQGTGK
jgi:hypothetical protein